MCTKQHINTMRPCVYRRKKKNVFPATRTGRRAHRHNERETTTTNTALWRRYPRHQWAISSLHLLATYLPAISLLLDGCYRLELRHTNRGNCCMCSEGCFHFSLQGNEYILNKLVATRWMDMVISVKQVEHLSLSISRPSFCFQLSEEAADEHHLLVTRPFSKNPFSYTKHAN